MATWVQGFWPWAGCPRIGTRWRSYQKGRVWGGGGACEGGHTLVRRDMSDKRNRRVSFDENTEVRAIPAPAVPMDDVQPEYVPLAGYNGTPARHSTGGPAISEEDVKNEGLWAFLALFSALVMRVAPLSDVVYLGKDNRLQRDSLSEGAYKAEIDLVALACDDEEQVDKVRRLLPYLANADPLLVQIVVRCISARSSGFTWAPLPAEAAVPMAPLEPKLREWTYLQVVMFPPYYGGNYVLTPEIMASLVKVTGPPPINLSATLPADTRILDFIKAACYYLAGKVPPKDEFLVPPVLWFHPLVGFYPGSRAEPPLRSMSATLFAEGIPDGGASYGVTLDSPQATLLATELVGRLLLAAPVDTPAGALLVPFETLVRARLPVLVIDRDSLSTLYLDAMRGPVNEFLPWDPRTTVMGFDPMYKSFSSLASLIAQLAAEVAAPAPIPLALPESAPALAGESTTSAPAAASASASASAEPESVIAVPPWPSVAALVPTGKSEPESLLFFPGFQDRDKPPSFSAWMRAVFEIAEEQDTTERAALLCELGNVCSQWSDWHNCPIENMRRAVCRYEWSHHFCIEHHEYTEWASGPQNLRAMAVVMYLCIRTIRPTFGHCATDMFEAFHPRLVSGNLAPGPDFPQPPEDDGLFSDVVLSAAFIPETRWWFAAVIRRLEGGQDLLDHMTREHGLVFHTKEELNNPKTQHLPLHAKPVLKRRREDDDPAPFAKAQRTE